MLAHDRSEVGGQFPAGHDVPSRLAMVASKELCFHRKNARSGPGMVLQQCRILVGAHRSQSQSANIVHQARGVSRVLVHEAGLRQLLGDDGAGQVVIPDVADQGVIQRLSHIRTRSNRQAHALQVIGSYHADSLENGASWKARRIGHRIRDP
jgi:hypothetical protein